MDKFYFKIIIGLGLLIFSLRRVDAQYFSGMESSVYTPVVNTFSQPASGAEMPYRWAVEIAGLHSFWSNNIIAMSPARFDWRQDSIDLSRYMIAGEKKHWGMMKANVSLLNFLLKIPSHPEWTVGAGWNIRSYASADRLNYNYQDTMRTLNDFLRENAFDQAQEGRFLNQQWTEWFVNVSKILKENTYDKWSAGASLKLIKGMSAEVVDVDRLQVGSPKRGAPHTLPVVHFMGRYAYSANLEDLDSASSFHQQKKAVFNGSPLSVGLDIGVTYTRKKPILIAGFTNDDPSDYEWKLSVALTDLGRLKYPVGTESRVISGMKLNPDADRLQDIFDQTSSLPDFNDSLAHYADLEPWRGALSVSLPTMLQIGYDQNLGRHFFVQAHLALDASFLNPGVDYRSHSLNYFTLTPRWEKELLGVYAPLYVNEKGRFLAGAAIRVGPLIAGVHDFGWLFHHSRSGGAFVGIVLRGLPRPKEDCPSF